MTITQVVAFNISENNRLSNGRTGEMRIWIDLTNSPHVNFFSGLIKELKDEHKIILTSRKHSNTIELLEIFGFTHHVIGDHPGKNILKKVNFFFGRVLKLYFYLKDKDIDVAISHSSFCSPMVSKMLGARVIYLNDNEHAIGNTVSFLFADQIMVPEFLDLRKVKRQWAKENQIVQYPGVKEGIYLWNYQPSSSFSFNMDNPENKQMIFVRPEPWLAQYYHGKKNFLDSLLLDLKDKYMIILLARDEQQKQYYSQEAFSGIVIPECRCRASIAHASLDSR